MKIYFSIHFATWFSIWGQHDAHVQAVSYDYRGAQTIVTPLVSEKIYVRKLQKAGRESPVIRPGDEAPLLVWGGEGSALRAAMRCLTEAGKPAMLGIDVLA